MNGSEPYNLPIRDDKKLVLIVDDNDKNLQLAASFLRKAGFDVAAANCAEEAALVLDEISPDLILLDIMMPGLNGFEYCRHLKANPNTKNIPVIFLTSLQDRDSVVEGLRTGAGDYIQKPYNSEELVARVSAQVELKTSREELMRQNLALRELGEEKDAFLGITAHDLRNPVQGIYGLAELLLTQWDNLDRTEKLDLITTIRNSAQTVNSIIRDILELSAMESGKINLNITEFSPFDLLKSITPIYKLKAESKSQNFQFRTSGPDCVLKLDTAKFERIVDNLVSNAIKYAKIEGSVTLLAAYEEEFSEFIFSVTDDGPGIRDNERHLLFKKFSKLSSIPTSGEPTTGLGLSIVKVFAEAMGGRVGFFSEFGLGSTFYVAFSAQPADWRANA